jgi:CheY-like chemotaxis protein
MSRKLGISIRYFFGISLDIFSEISPNERSRRTPTPVGRTPERARFVSGLTPRREPRRALWWKAPTCVTIRHVGTTVVIVDDHKAFRRSARKLLELGGFEVVGEAEDGASGAALVRELEPDVVLLDVALPDTSGFAVAEELADAPSSVVLVSSRDPADLGPLIAKSPAVGFIPKEQLTSAAIRELLGEAA